MEGTTTLFLCGDVMAGRGIDQVLPHPVDPTLHEPWVKDAREYVALAEEAHGPIPDTVDFAYPWGDALEELERVAPAARVINLETAVTTHGEPWPGKGIHYRMHPENVPCLTAAGVDVCSLANNHVLDWGRPGLLETLDTVEGAGIATAGAGPDRGRATEPAVVELPPATAGGGGGRGEGEGDAGEAGEGQGASPPSRLLVFAAGSVTSGVYPGWEATEDRSGVRTLGERTGDAFVSDVAARVRRLRRPGDLVAASIHWGGNWGYEIPRWQRGLAHRLVERAGVDLVHGHSSHHVKGLEVFRGKLILYGCGDFLTDYEGIGGHEEYRGHLGLMYFPTFDRASGDLAGLTMTPTRMHRFQVRRALPDQAGWLAGVLTREGEPFGTAAGVREDGRLELQVA